MPAGVSAYPGGGIAGLAAQPNLHFTVEAVLTTVGGVTLLYRNHRGQRVAETMLFAATSGLVARGIAAYATG